MVYFGLVVVHIVREAWIVEIVDILLLGSRDGLSSRRLLIIERRKNGSVPCWLSKALIMHLLKETECCLQASQLHFIRPHLNWRLASDLRFDRIVVVVARVAPISIFPVPLPLSLVGREMLRSHSIHSTLTDNRNRADISQIQIGMQISF